MTRFLARPSMENSNVHWTFSPSRAVPTNQRHKKSPTHEGFGVFWWSWWVLPPRPIDNSLTHYRFRSFGIS